MELEKYCFHWRKGYRYDFPIQREAFGALFRSLKGRRITVLTGTRRTGKTTLMKQLIDSLVDKGVPSQNIIYFSFDEEQPSIGDIVDEYQLKRGLDIVSSSEKFFFFLDEVQKLEDWQNKVKYFYDHYKNLKFIITGSASLFIRKGVRESLAGRVREFYLGPLNFREYLNFTDNNELISKPQLFSDTLKKEFERYIPRQFIEMVQESEGEVQNYALSILEKVVYIDIPKLVELDDPNILMSLVKLISSNPGMLVDYSRLADALSSGSPVSRVRISNYIRYLEDAYIIRLGYNYSRSGVKSARKMKKAYTSNPSLSLISTIPPPLAKLIEQSFFLNMSSEFFWRNPQKQEVDLILDHESKPLPVEIKYKNQISKSDLKGIKSFMTQHKADRGIVITKDTERIQQTPQGTIQMIPAWKAALLGLDCS